MHGRSACLSAFWAFLQLFVCKVVNTEFANDCVAIETQTHYSTSGCALWPICSDSQHQGKKIHCVLTRGWHWVVVEIMLWRILLHHVFWPCIQSARQNFKSESISKYLFQGKVRWLFQKPALLFSIFRGLLEQLQLWASSKLEIYELQSQLLLTDTARCRFHKQLWQVLYENRVKILWINLDGVWLYL